MKIAYHQLQQQLGTHLQPIYLVSGDEYLLVDDAVQKIYTYARNFDYVEREIFQVEPHFEWEQLLANAYNLSLFTTKSILELRIPNAKPGDVGSKVLQSYAKQPPKDKLLVIVTSKLDAAAQKSAWVKAIENVGLVVQIWALEGQQLMTWFASRIKMVGIDIDQRDIKLLIEHSEGNLLAAAQDIEKLRLLYGEGRINTEQILAALSDNARFDVYDFVMSALLGDAKRAVRILECLKQEGLATAIILWAITRELRSLIAIRRSLQQAHNIDDVLQAHRIRQQQKTAYKAVLKRHTVADFTTMLHSAAEIDFLIKGAEKGNVWHDLTALGLQLAR